MTKQPIKRNPEIIGLGLRPLVIKLGVIVTAFRMVFTSSGNPLEVYRNFLRLIRSEKVLYRGIKNKHLAKVGGRYFFSMNFPGWPSPAFDSLRRNLIARRMNASPDPVNQTIFFAITNRCPLKCVHCYEWDNLGSGELLSFEDLVTILRKIEDQGIRHIQLSGGEPLARFNDLLKLMQSARYPIDFWILTSGFGLDADKAQQLRLAGLTGVCISLDHWDETGHNAIRNNPQSFHWAKVAAESCLAQGIVVTFGLCAIKNFISEENLTRYYQLCHSLGASFVRILEPRSVGRYSQEQTVLSAEEITILEDFFLASRNEKRWKGFPIINYPGYIQRREGCSGGGKLYMYIDSHGMFKPCPFCDTQYGSALTGSISSAIQQMSLVGCHKI